jgi:integrase
MRITAALYIMIDPARGIRERLTFDKGRARLPQGYAGKFYLRPYVEGKRIWQSFDALDLALSARDQLAVSYDRKRQGLPTINPLEAVKTILAPSYAKGTIAGAVEEFITYCESRVGDWRTGGDNGLAPNSVTAYKKAMQDFAASCIQFGATQMSEFQGERGKAILLHFKKWLGSNIHRRSGKSAHGDARKFVIVDTFLARNGVKCSKDRKFNPTDPGLLDYRDVPRVKKSRISDVTYYTPRDIRAMLEATDSYDKDQSIYDAQDLKELVLTFVLTGCRDEEIQHLTWKNVNGKITIADQPAYDWRVKDHEKRLVEIPEVLRNWIEGRRARVSKHEDLVFPTSVGTPNQNFADHINGLQKRAEAADYKFSRPECRKHVLHNFRRSYATYQMIVEGQSPRDIQRDLGHSELSTTEKYLASVGNSAARKQIVTEYQKLLRDYSKPKTK